MIGSTTFPPPPCPRRRSPPPPPFHYLSRQGGARPGAAVEVLLEDAPRPTEVRLPRPTRSPVPVLCSENAHDAISATPLFRERPAQLSAAVASFRQEAASFCSRISTTRCALTRRTCSIRAAASSTFSRTTVPSHKQNHAAPGDLVAVATCSSTRWRIASWLTQASRISYTSLERFRIDAPLGRAATGRLATGRSMARRQSARPRRHAHCYGPGLRSSRFTA